jgi:hypothetical protein
MSRTTLACGELSTRRSAADAVLDIKPHIRAIADGLACETAVSVRPKTS